MNNNREIKHIKLTLMKNVDKNFDHKRFFNRYSEKNASSCILLVKERPIFSRSERPEVKKTQDGLLYTTRKKLLELSYVALTC